MVSPPPVIPPAGNMALPEPGSNANGLLSATNSLLQSRGLPTLPTNISATGGDQYDIVYMGPDDNGNPVTLTKFEAKQQLLTSTGPSQQALAQIMQLKYGKNWKKRSPDPVISDLLDAASYRYVKYGEKVTPLDASIQAIESWNKLIGGPGGGGGGGAAAPTKAVNLTDPGTAKTLLNQALESYLGKKASPKEVDTFLKALNVQEMKNPTDTTIQNGMVVRSGGFNPATFAEDYAAGMEGAGEFKAATSLLDTFIGSLANPVRV